MFDTFVELAATSGGIGLDGVDPRTWAAAFSPRPLEQTQAGSTVATAELFAGEQGLAEPPAGSGLATAGLQYRSVDVMHRYRAAAQQ